MYRIRERQSATRKIIDQFKYERGFFVFRENSVVYIVGCVKIY